MKTARRLAASALALALIAPPAAAHPPERPGPRLPALARPIAYTVHLRPDVAKAAFTGEEAIQLRLTEATDRLVLHANEVVASQVTLDGVPATGLSPDPGRQRLTIYLPRTFGPGEHTLRLRFRGVINTLSRGLWSMSYTDRGAKKTMLATELEPVDARRLFPLFDEPGYRAVFRLSVDMPTGQLAVSNMPETRRTRLAGGWTRFAFAPTPPMPSYLLVLCAGELETIGRRVDGVDVRVVTTRGKAARGRYALGVAAQLLPYYRDYFGVAYPLPKLDLIARPGGWGGAMENWGGITFHEARLLHAPGTSSLAELQDVYTIVAHELAHQWFGNLVTMAWWDDLWLNEGFASWMELKAADRFNPSWAMWAEGSGGKAYAMARDAQRTTHPIQQPIVDATDAETAFDAITYSKGQAFVAMLEAAMGEEAFRAGIRRYMRKHAYGNTRTADLWAALGEGAKLPVARIAPPWTQRPGFPLVEAGLTSEGLLTLQQRRFMADGKAEAAAPWPVPIVMDVGGKPRSVLFEGRSAAFSGIPAGARVKLNLGDGGLYRVRYDAPLFARLKAGFGSLPAPDQVNMLDDAWALAQAGHAPVGERLALVGTLGPKSAPAAWMQALDGLSTLAELAQGTPGEAAFHAAVRARLGPTAASLGWDARPGDAPPVRRLRPALLMALGLAGDKAVIKEARARFARFRARPASLDPDLRATVLELVGHHAAAVDFDALAALAARSEEVESKQRYLRAIDMAKAEPIAARALKLSLAAGLDPTLAVGLVQGVAVRHPALARAFLQGEGRRLLAGRTPGDAADVVKGVYRRFSDAAAADELMGYAKRTIKPAGMKEIAEAAETIRFRAGLKARLMPAVGKWAAELSP